MVRIVDLLPQVQVDEERLDAGVIPFRETFHVKCPHRLRW
jgi:hypothetical protein